MSIRHDALTRAAMVLMSTVLTIAFAHAASAEPAGCKPIKKLPTTIKKWGDYCLTKSFKVRVPSGNAIEVTGDNIVIDLNGHTIANKSNGNTAVGVFAGQRSNVTVRNGTLVGFERAVFLQDFLPHETAVNNLVEDLRVINSSIGGIAVFGPRSTVRRSHVMGVGSPETIGGFGIEVTGAGSRVLDSDVTDIRTGVGQGAGILMKYADGGLVRDCRVQNVSSGNSQATWGILVDNSDDAMVRGSDVSNISEYGIGFSSSSGFYMDNEVYRTAQAYAGGGTPAGDTNHQP